MCYLGWQESLAQLATLVEPPDSRLRPRGLLSTPDASAPRPPDRHSYLVNAAFGGRIIYWREPDGHVWELLNVSYERQPQPQKPESL